MTSSNGYRSRQKNGPTLMAANLVLIFDEDHGLRCYEQQLTKLMIEIAAMMMVIRRMVLLLLHKRLGVTKK